MNDTMISKSIEPLERARHILAKQPFSVLIGAEMDAFETGSVQISIPILPKLLQQHGFVHGGVISYQIGRAHV